MKLLATSAAAITCVTPLLVLPMHLEKASQHPPPGLQELLQELGEGESGFSGTPFGRGVGTLADFLSACIAGEAATPVASDMVPQTIFWMIDDAGLAVGMVRARHRLTDRLLMSGGHIGYYVKSSERGKGHATRALQLAAEFLRSRGVEEALVTVHPENAGSIRVAIANGGRLDTPGQNPESGHAVSRYWVTTAHRD